MALIKQTKETEVFDKKTGELTKTSTENLVNQKVSNKDEFVYTFTKNLGYLSNLNRGEILTLFGLFRAATMDNKIYVNKAMKEEIAKEFKLSDNTVHQNIKNLKDKGMIVNTARGLYVLNAHFFGRGDIQELKKVRILHEFDFIEQTQKTAIEHTYSTKEEKALQEKKEMEEKYKALEAKLREYEKQNNSLFSPEEIAPDIERIIDNND